jgi:hypothetical protein
MVIVGYAICVGDHLPLAAGPLALHHTTLPWRQQTEIQRDQVRQNFDKTKKNS